MIFRLIYDLALHLLALVMLPKMAYQALVHGKYRKNFFARFGKGFPKIDKKGKPLIWIHAVSVGEVRAIASLAHRFKEDAAILISTVTETGHAEARRHLPFACAHVYLPFDFAYIIKPIVKRIAPDLVMITETDFWLHFQHAVKSCGARLLLVNGKVSTRSYQRYLRFPVLAKYLFAPFDHFFVQGTAYAKRFNHLGIDENKITVTGNLKLDHYKQEAEGTLHHVLKVEEEDLILTIGSTHAPEEKIFLSLLPDLYKKFPRLKVLLVPRHPERFREVVLLMQKHHLPFGVYSNRYKLNERLVLIDAMGLLSECYQLSDLAFVGGSLTPRVGGHNILEPSQYGVPVLFGPHMQGQPDFLELVRGYRAGKQVSEHSLQSTLETLLKSKIQRRVLGMNGLKLIRDAQGSLEKTYWNIINLVNNPQA